MKKVFLNIIKEDSANKDSTDVAKENSVPYIIVGDSIAKAMIASRKELRSGYYPAVEGGKSTQWILDNFKSQLESFDIHKDPSWFESASLIIIAGTNDGHGAGMTGNPNYFINRAVKNVKEMINQAQQRGIKKAAIMKLAIFDRDPNSKAMKDLVYDRKFNKGKKNNNDEIIRGPDGYPTHPWMKKDRTAEQWIEDHKKFVEGFNNELKSLGVPLFDMVKLATDRVHADKGQSTILFDNARKVLGDISSIIIPASQSGKDKLTTAPDRACSVNSYCDCVDRLVSDTVTVAGVQKALKKLGVSVKETGYCDGQTKKAIQAFQKSQQDTYKPKNREFLRCDACVGVNTTDAINLQLKALGSDETLQSISGTGPSSTPSNNSPANGVQVSVSHSTSTKISQSGDTELKDKYTVLELYQIAKKHAPSNATEEDVRTMAAIAIAESGGKRANTFGCKNPRKNPNYDKNLRYAERKKDKKLGNKKQQLERAYLKKNPMYFGQGSGCRFGDNSLGLWQINMINPTTKSKNLAKYGMTSEKDLHNPDKNAQVAWSYWSNPRRRFRPWTTWLRRGESGCRFTPALRELNRILEQSPSNVSENKNINQEARDNMSKKIKIKITEGGCNSDPCTAAAPLPAKRHMAKMMARDKHMHTSDCEKPSDYKNAHNGEEARMHRTTLAHLMADVKVLLDLVQDSDDLPEWLETKITKAGDYMSSAARYVAGNKARDMGQLEEEKNCGCGQTPCKTYGKKSKLQLEQEDQIQMSVPVEQAKQDLRDKMTQLEDSIDGLSIEDLTKLNQAVAAAFAELSEALSYSKGLIYHLENNIPVSENVFRPGSDEYFKLFKEVRTLNQKGMYDLTEEEEFFINETPDLGEWAFCEEEGEMVPLDFPLYENASQQLLDEKRKKKKKKKDPPIGKPTKTTGGGKKYKVFVRNPKTGKIKKITYGDSKGGLKGNWNSAEARKSFASRHNCKDKKDRTKAGYWACRAHKDFGSNVSGRFW